MRERRQVNSGENTGMWSGREKKLFRQVTPNDEPESLVCTCVTSAPGVQV